jgi:hypothetical protein
VIRKAGIKRGKGFSDISSDEAMANARGGDLPGVLVLSLPNLFGGIWIH